MKRIEKTKSRSGLVTPPASGPLYPCRVGHDSGYYGNGQCKECRRISARAYSRRIQAAKGPPKPGERYSGICLRGHVRTGNTNSDRRCHTCTIEIQRERRAAERAVNPGPRAEARGKPRTCKVGHRAIVGQICKECRSASNRRSRENPENRAKQRARYTVWLGENRDKAKEATVRWQREHPLENAALKRNRAAAKKGAPGKVTAAEWRAILKKYKQRCAYCKKKPPKGESLQQDHVVPLQGKDVKGTNYAFNIVPSCLKCNVAKLNRVDPGLQHTLFDRFTA